MSIPTSKQTIYVKETGTIDAFEWAGKCAALSGIIEGLGDSTFATADLPDRRELQRMDTSVSVSDARPPIEAELSLKKQVKDSLHDRLLRCRWHIDIRYQEKERRDDPSNWERIDRLCSSAIQAYGTDAEVARSGDDNAAIVTALPVLAPPPLHTLHRLKGETELTKDVTITCMDICHGGTCSEDCRVIVGTQAEVTNPEMGISDDGGQSFTWYSFDGTSGPEWTTDILAVACVGDFILVVSADAFAFSIDGWTTYSEEEDFGTDLARACAVADYAYWMTDANVIHRGWSITHVSDRMYEGGEPGSFVDFDSTDDVEVIEALHDRFTVAGLSTGDFLVWNGEGWDLIGGPLSTALSDICLRSEDIWIVLYQNGAMYWTDDGGASFTADTSFPANAGTTGLFPASICMAGCERYMVVGSLVETGPVYTPMAWENVNGAPGYWEEVEVPATDGYELTLVDWCNENEFVAIGVYQNVYLQPSIVVRIK